MSSPDTIYKPYTPDTTEVFAQLLSRIEILKRQFPNIGLLLNRVPLDQKIRIFNTAEPPAMQFKPKNIEEMRKLIAEIKETASNTIIHLPNPKFDDATGMLGGKEEIIEILKQETGNNFNLIATHLGWKDADLILDEQGNWRETALANKVVDELADVFIASIQSGKTMTMENVSEKPKFRETLGTKPEHLVVVREKIAEVISAKTGMPADEVLSKIGYTFDVGHAVKNTRLIEQSPIEFWLKQLGENIKLMHIHDVLPPTEAPVIENGIKYQKEQRDHKPIGEGIIDWKSFFELADKHCPDIPMILEINPIDDETGAGTTKSIDYLASLK